MGRLEGKSVIITGAGSGIGRAASLLFTREGAKLIAVDRSESVMETAKLVSESGERGVTLIPLAIYFVNGRAKVEIGVARGKQQHDKRDAIRKKEMDRELRRTMTQRQ